MLTPGRRISRAIQSRFVRRLLQANKPDVILVSGSFGKTTTKNFIAHVLSNKFRVRQSEFSLNTEFDLASWVLGIPKSVRLSTLLKNRKELKRIESKKRFAEILVCEGAASVEIGKRKKILRYTTRMLKPRIGVLTEIGPNHMEFFGTVENIAKEKKELITNLSSESFAIMNYDSRYVRNVSHETPARKIFFGFKKQADYSFQNIKVSTDGIKADLDYPKGRRSIVLPQIINRVHLYNILPAIICARIYKMNWEDIDKQLEVLSPVWNRGNLVRGIRDTMFINDSYNANIEAVLAALKTLEEYASERRRVAVLGEMRELGDLAEPHHRKAGQAAAEVADILICVNKDAKIIADEAKKSGMDGSKIFYVEGYKKATKKLKDIMKSQDVILVKGSHGNELWKLVLGLRPEKVGDN